MDTNKLIVLNKIGYHPVKCCGVCANAEFQYGSVFGVCKVYTYIHNKHGNERKLSIHKYGMCNGDKFVKGEREAVDDFNSYLEKPLDKQ